MARKKKNNASQISPAVGVIVLGAVILIAAIILLLTQRQSQVSLQTPAAGTENNDIPFPQVPRVSLQDAKTAFDQGSAVFVDVRSASSYQEEHLSGALSIPEAEMPARIGELDPQDWIITYCT